MTSSADGPTVAEVMLRRPGVLGPAATVAEVQEVFTHSHVHLVLLTDSGRLGGLLLGTLDRTDLVGGLPGERALDRSVLVGRTVQPGAAADDVRRRLLSAGQRRAAVVDDDGMLLGLLCLKGHGRGFCTDAGVAARRLAPGA